MSPVEQLTADRPLVPALALARPRARALVVVAVLVLAGLSFLAPSAPTYDPWAWIVWGREVLHLDLSTVDGPSWKPLPVLLTTPFALAGPLAPDLWLYVARVGALAGVVVVFGLVRRLGGGVVGASAAAAAYASAPWTIRNAALGNSEGLLVALALGAVDRHLAGRRGAGLRARGRRGAPATRGVAVPRPLRRVPPLARARPPAPRGRRLRPAARRCGCCPSCGGRATCCGRCTARRRRAPTAPPSRRTRRAPCSTSSRPCSRPAAWLGVAALVAVLALGLVRGRGRPSGRRAARRRRPGAGRRRVGRRSWPT